MLDNANETTLQCGSLFPGIECATARPFDGILKAIKIWIFELGGGPMIITAGGRYGRLFLMASLVGLVLSGSAIRMIAQNTTAGIAGIVTDQGGAVFPGVTITATGESTGFTRSVVTGGGGAFSLLELPLGTYKLTAEKAGFKKYEHSGFGPLGAGQLAHLDITMMVGTAQETVNVSGVAPLLQTENNVIRTPVFQDQIDSLPLNSRSPVELLLQQPGAQIALQYSAPGSGSEYLGFNFNGQNYIGNNYLVDGTDATVVSDQTITIDGGNLVMASVDSIAEFDTGSQNYSAEVKGSGGYVNLITKSGSNNFHGDVFEFLRNTVLDATPYFGTGPEQLRLNDFGGIVTGPIWRNKTFFMGSYEGQRIRRPTPIDLTVPTAAFRATVNPVFNQFLIDTPLPTSPIAGSPNIGTFIANPSSADREDLVTGRVDQIFSEKDSLFARYTGNFRTDVQPQAFVDYSDNITVRHQYATLSETHVFSSTLLNTVKLGVNRYLEPLVFGGQTPSTLGMDGFSVPGMNIAGGYVSLVFAHTAGSIVDALTWVKGKHSLKFGGTYWGAIMGRDQFQSYSWTFQTDQAFALDQPQSVFSYFGPGKILPDNHYHDTQQSLYVQDDFRATHDLTLNLGVRYDNFGLMKETTGITENVVDNPLGPFRAPGQPLYHRNNLDFAPRIGFAWMPFGQKHLVLRGGYGLFWGGPGSLEAPVNYQLNSINTFNVTSLDNPNLAYPLNLQAVTGILAAPGRYIVDPNAGDFYTEQWNLTTEYQISDSTTVRAAYVGNHGVHVPGDYEPNDFDPLLGSRPDPAIGQVYEQLRAFYTLYDGLELSYRRRLARGLGADAHYTWSHAIGIESGMEELSSGIGIGSEQIQSFQNLAASRGNLPFDVRHQLALDFHYEFPQANLSSRLLRKVATGWGLSGIATITSGDPFDIITGGDTGDGRLIQRPNIVPGVNPYINGGSPPNGMLNIAAFAVPIIANPSTGLILGDMGNNVLRTRPFFTMDSALAKNTKIGEKFTLQFRAEFFNVTNHPNFGAPFNSMAVPALFGKSMTVGPGREGQLALKLLF
jgi:hypothetical protein